MPKAKVSETHTENIFRAEYGPDVFIEKDAILPAHGFKSKGDSANAGLPDFFREEPSFVIVVEAKATKHAEAEHDIQHYMKNNDVTKDIIGIALSGQQKSQLKVSYFYRPSDATEVTRLGVKDTLLTLADIRRIHAKAKYGETISEGELRRVLKDLNDTFQKGNVRDTDRSLFFSGLMIALKDDTFRNTYKAIEAPSLDEVSATKVTVRESHKLNRHVLDAISGQLESRINNLSKDFSWRDMFSFIKNIDFPLTEYKQIISTIETQIFHPYQHDEKQDILGKAYKIFLSRAGKIDNKNIILTPDHIKTLMVNLAHLTVDDIVLDTCTGSGGFLMEAMERMLTLAKDDPERTRNIKEHQLIGFETDSVLFALACSNMFLHGDGRTNMLYRSSLLGGTQEALINSSEEDLYKYIRSLHPRKCIINPPYENNLPIRFAQQAIDYLDDNGKLIAIMPTPTLTRNAPSGGGGRTSKLLESARLEFVIRMPSNLFSEQNRAVNTSIFGFAKTPHSEDDEVLFLDLSDDGLVSVQHKGRIDLHGRWGDIQKAALSAVNNFKEVDGLSERRRIYKDGDLIPSGVQSQRTSRYPLVRLGDLFTMEKGTLQSSKAVESGEYDFITAATNWSKHNKYTHDQEAIVFAISAAGSLGRAHYVKGKFVASDLCLILTPRQSKGRRVNVEFYTRLLELLRPRLVADLADGTSKLTISPALLMDYFVEYVPIGTQNQFVKTHLAKQKKALESLQRVEREMETSLAALL